MHPEKYSIRLQRSHNRLCSPLLIRRTKLSEEATVSIEESKTFLANFPSEFELRFFESERERGRIRHPAFSAGERYKSVTEMDLLILKMGKATRVIDPVEEREERGGRFLDGKEAKAENCSAQRRKSQR